MSDDHHEGSEVGFDVGRAHGEHEASGRLAAENARLLRERELFARVIAAVREEIEAQQGEVLVVLEEALAAWDEATGD